MLLKERGMRLLIAPALLLVALAGCASNPSATGPNLAPEVPLEAREPVPSGASALRLAWARTDGRLISGDSNLTAQAQTTIAECGATAPPVRTADGVAGEACMGERGYYLRELSS